jgi:mRNA interferase MazF
VSDGPRRGVRGQVFSVDLGHGPKPWVIVSNNARNRNLDTVLAARITNTSRSAHVPTVVPLTAADPLVGFVLADDIVQLFHEELSDNRGALSASTMAAVSRALRVALP